MVVSGDEDDQGGHTGGCRKPRQALSHDHYGCVRAERHGDHRQGEMIIGTHESRTATSAFIAETALADMAFSPPISGGSTANSPPRSRPVFSSLGLRDEQI